MTILDAGKRVVMTELVALQALHDSIGAAFVEAVELIAGAKGRVVLTGIGKSGHIAAKIAATMASTGTPAQFVHAAEASHGDMGMISTDDIIIALSKSGESQELGDVIAYAKRFSIPLVAITADNNSTLGQAASICLQLPNMPEATDAVAAPTTSTTLTLVLGDALAVALLEQKGFTATDFRTFHPGGKLGAQLKTVAEVMHTSDAVPLVAPNTPMTEAALVISEKRMGCVGVIENGGLAGIITDGDLRRHMATLNTATAGDVMSANAKTIAPTLLAAEALAIMNEKSITQLFVTDNGKPVGVIHLHDLLRLGVI